MQVSRAAQALPSQDADVLVSGPDGASDVDPNEFLHADFSDCDDVPELSVGSLGDVGWGSAHCWQGSGFAHSRAVQGIGRGQGRAGSWLAASYHVPPMSSRQRMSLCVSEPAPLDSLRVSPPVSFSQPTFVLTLLSPFGSVSNLTTTSFSRV